MKIYLLLSLFIFSSCSLIKKEERPNYLESYQKVKNSDYLDYYKTLGDTFKKFHAGYVHEIKGRYARYLNSVYEKLRRNNELLLHKKEKPSFYIISNPRPIYFSLPGGQFFFSTGLFSKYVRNEDLLSAVLASESIRWHAELYPQKLKVPVGYVSNQEILNTIRLPLKLRSELNKWSYNVIKRSGVDAGVYLSWLQLQNKNVLDFSMLLGDVNIMAKEEFMFKDFLIGLDIENENNRVERRSSEEFYKLKNYIRRRYETRKI